MNRLWAPWRIAYVTARAPAGCIFCQALSDADDRRALVLHRTARAFLILNAYPYATGHLMAVVNRHVPTIADAAPDEVAEAMELVRRAAAALTAEYRAEGFNFGWNQGRLAGAGVEDHLHFHIVPRWLGDTNFMPVVGDARVLPEALDTTYARLKERLGD